MPLPTPSDDDVAAICARVARRILRLVDGDESDDDHGAALLTDAGPSQAKWLEIKRDGVARSTRADHDPHPAILPRRTQE